MNNIWDPYLTDRDRKVAEVSGYGARSGLGKRPAILVIDTIINFAGTEPLPLFESMKQWRNSCGEEAWAAAQEISRILDVGRQISVPIFYSTNETPRRDGLDSGRWRSKNSRRMEDASHDRSAGNEILPVIAPQAGDFVIRKTKPSVFFGTPLSALLNDLDVDTLICCGGTTSGCVRATVLDAFSANFYVGVPQEACFDRSQASHAINLFDLDQKYADVMTTDAVISYLQGLEKGYLDSRIEAAARESTR